MVCDVCFLAAQFTSHGKIVLFSMNSRYTASVWSVEGEFAAANLLLVLRPPSDEQCQVIAIKRCAGSKFQPERKEGSRLVAPITQRAQTDG